jgi:hypothetical protein
MPIDLDGLALIDTMLDCIIELRLMPIAWSKEAEEDIARLHETLLGLNELWQELERPSTIELEAGRKDLLKLRNEINVIVACATFLYEGKFYQIPQASVPVIENLFRDGRILLEMINLLYERFVIRAPGNGGNF